MNRLLSNKFEKEKQYCTIWNKERQTDRYNFK